MTTNTAESTKAETNTDESKPKIYVACLSAYNSGYLHGAWIVPKETVEELLEQINQVLKTSPMEDAEEWAIHDYDNFPNLGEYPDLEKVCEVQRAFESFEPSIVIGYIENIGRSYINDSLTENIEGAFVGTYDSFKDYAYEHAEDTVEGLNSGSTLATYFDWDAYSRDLGLDHWEAVAPNFQTHIFRSY